MKKSSYLQTPPGIMQVLHLFSGHKLSYILFKCEHIFAGQNKNLDILFETNEDYTTAGKILQEQEFIVRLSEKVEKYKTMYCGLIDETLYSIHLHREIAWHGMKALDKKPVFQNAKHVHPLITIPGMEDSILIHAAHVLFENFKVKEREKNYFLTLKEPSINKEYIRWQIRKNNWERGFWKVVRFNRLSKVGIAKLWLEKVWKEPSTAAYLLLKAMRIPIRAMSFKRKGCLIALIGVNGSGKSTLAKKTLEEYLPITSHLGKKQHYYYFGWKPTFILTKITSRIMVARNKKLFRETMLTNFKIGFKEELIFLGQFVEFLYRYLTEIYPLLRKDHLVISDRYIYDIYGQYPCAKQSKIVKHLILLFPRPDKIYVLDAEIPDLSSRSKTDKSRMEVHSIKRIIFSADYLQQQKINYQNLASQLSFAIIDTSGQIQKNVDEVIKDSWRECV